MDQLPLPLNVRDAHQLERLIIEVDGKILRQKMLLLRHQLAQDDTKALQAMISELQQDVAKLRAQRTSIDISLGLRRQAAE